MLARTSAVRRIVKPRPVGIISRVSFPARSAKADGSRTSWTRAEIARVDSMHGRSMPPTWPGHGPLPSFLRDRGGRYADASQHASRPLIRTEETPHVDTDPTAAELDALRRYNTPTISNAIELFDVRPRHLGFLPHTIRCLLPNLGPIVGYAVTSRTRASRPELTEAKVDLLGDYLRYVAVGAGPEDRGRLGPRRAAGARCSVWRGHGDDPPEARLCRTHHQRLPTRPRRSRGARLPALRPEPLRQPCLRAAGRFRLAGRDRGSRNSQSAT